MYTNATMIYYNPRCITSLQSLSSNLNAFKVFLAWANLTILHTLPRMSIIIHLQIPRETLAVQVPDIKINQMSLFYLSRSSNPMVPIRAADGASFSPLLTQETAEE